MKRKVSVLLVPILAMLLMATKCNTSKVSTYVSLAVDATVNGLQLATSFGATVPQSTIDEVKNDGDLVKKAVADWVAAGADQKAGAWAEVKKDLDIFKTNLPAILNAIHVDNPAYQGIVGLAITAIEEVVNVVEGMNATAGAPKKASTFDAKAFKSDYNNKMTSAGHPELHLQ